MNKLKWTTRACGIFLLWATTAVALPAQTFTTLHSFDGTDGFEPLAGLIQGTDGNLYGTTFGGGVYGPGSVFKITPSGTLKTLHSFHSTEGSAPRAALVQGTDGNFYGTTEAGGSSGNGNVFKITPSGTLTSLYTFCPARRNCTDGSSPEAGLVQGTDGNFYGTTVAGGAGGRGAVFKITPSGALTTLHSFHLTDGQFPHAGLAQGTDGNFYGTTQFGGRNSDGTVFQMTPGGTLTTLHSFEGTDGSQPKAGLVQGTDGNFYGTTLQGGANGCGAFGCGTVFKITPSGTLTTLHSFDGTDGSGSIAGLVQATDGNLYGTTPLGGANGIGTVFKITPSGTLTTLHNFDNANGDGAEPNAGLVQGTDGNFYGTAAYSGAKGNGTIFSVSVGLGRFVETQPTSGTVGASVNILGTNLTGAISVSFNGTAATFTVVSRSLITTTVPAGATTGTVQVTGSGGTLSSNVPFTVK